MPSFSTFNLVLTCAIVLLLARPAHAFGAGNIASVAKIEGSNWRHGDIEDTLLTLVMSRAAGGKKWDKMNVARVYFGNWLRDYSQAIDVGTVKYVSAEAIRILLWVLGFMTFGFGTKEFEVTTDRLGCYRPEDHIDNPKDYADNEDATQYDRRLRGPVDERVELGIDPATGMKNYIANERAGIMTSALHVRRLFGESIRLGRNFARSGNKAELYEALRLLGTGLHCLEDFSAHSNYTELALIEMGERSIFPHVGSRTQIRLQGARGEVYPLITGTFGGVDFLHSVMGEVSDKATQSEIEELEGTMVQGSRADTSELQNLLNKIPSGLFGGKDEGSKAEELKQNATTAQMNQTRVSPRDPEAFTLQMQEVVQQIYPIIEWHDEVMLSITETIEKIPILPDLLEQLQEEITKFVFSLLAPFVLPIISQIKAELNTGSSEIIQSSKAKQLVVFHDDSSTDPTHSMLSKDHFSNVLNEPAGKIASQVVKWVVPQLIAAWDDESIDVNRTIDRIVNGVFHHPAQRNQGNDGAADGRQLMFQVVESWWNEQDQRYQQQLRRKLSREGVQNGENHKEGVHDKGHGCGKPLGMQKVGPSGKSGKSSSGNAFSGHEEKIGKLAGEAVGGGALGGLVGALAGGIGGSLLSGAFGGNKQKETSQGYTPSGDYQQSYTETGHSGNKYGQAEVTETKFSGGGSRTEYQKYEQSGSQGYGYDQRTEVRPTHGGGYEQTTTTQQYGRPARRKSYEPESEHASAPESEPEDDEDDEYTKEEKKRLKKEAKKHKKEEKKHKKHADYSEDDDDDDDKNKYGRKERRKSNGSEDDDDDYNKKKKEKKSKKYADQDSEDDDDDDKRKYGRERRKSNDSDDDGGYKKEKKEKKKKYKDDDDSEDEKRKKYGGRDNEYGGGRGNEERGGYGGQERRGGGYGGGEERREHGGGYGGEQRGGYGGGEQRGGGYGGGNQYGGGQQEYGGGNQYGGQQQYGGGEHRGGYGQQEQHSGYGGGEQRGGYGGGEQHGGYGGEQRGGYGGEERRGGRGQEEYGNMPGAFGDDDEERRGGHHGERRQGYGEERRW